MVVPSGVAILSHVKIRAASAGDFSIIIPQWSRHSVARQNPRGVRWRFFYYYWCFAWFFGVAT
jgi:hypothetical protein